MVFYIMGAPLNGVLYNGAPLNDVLYNGRTIKWHSISALIVGTRLGTNALQATLFTVIWKLLEDEIAKGNFGFDPTAFTGAFFQR